MGRTTASARRQRPDERPERACGGESSIDEGTEALRAVLDRARTGQRWYKGGGGEREGGGGENAGGGGEVEAVWAVGPAAIKAGKVCGGI